MGRGWGTLMTMQTDIKLVTHVVFQMLQCHLLSYVKLLRKKLVQPESECHEQSLLRICHQEHMPSWTYTTDKLRHAQSYNMYKTSQVKTIAFYAFIRFFLSQMLNQVFFTSNAESIVFALILIVCKKYPNKKKRKHYRLKNYNYNKGLRYTLMGDGNKRSTCRDVICKPSIVQEGEQVTVLLFLKLLIAYTDSSVFFSFSSFSYQTGGIKNNIYKTLQSVDKKIHV